MKQVASQGGVYKRRGLKDKEQDFGKIKLTTAGYPIHNYLDDFKRERFIREEKRAKTVE